MSPAEHQVLLYLRATPGVTVRRIAQDVFGGSGCTRTSSRARAYQNLRRLERGGYVYRHKPPEYGNGLGDLWYPTEEALERV